MQALPCVPGDTRNNRPERKCLPRQPNCRQQAEKAVPAAPLAQVDVGGAVFATTMTADETGHIFHHGSEPECSTHTHRCE